MTHLRSLTEVLKEELTFAMKNKNDVEKNILRVVLGEIETQESRSGTALPKDKVEGIIRKIVTSNEETIKELASNEEVYGTFSRSMLEQENEYISQFLPKRLTLDEIRSIFAYTSNGVIPQIITAKSEGQAVGLAMKFLKENDKAVDGNDVKTVVQEIRSV